MPERTEGEATWERVRDDLPESFWEVTTWLPGSNYVTGRLDGADRKRIGMAIIAVLTSLGNPCDNYAGSMTCLTAGSMTPCDQCRRRSSPAERTP